MSQTNLQVEQLDEKSIKELMQKLLETDTNTVLNSIAALAWKTDNPRGFKSSGLKIDEWKTEDVNWFIRVGIHYGFVLGAALGTYKSIYLLQKEHKSDEVSNLSDSDETSESDKLEDPQPDPECFNDHLPY